jgi:hypothetical protein
MGIENLGFAVCQHCGSQFRLFTIFNRDMGGLCKAWRNRHEPACANRTPSQRLAWARPYIGKNRTESSLVVDVAHDGFKTPNGQAQRPGTAAPDR